MQWTILTAMDAFSSNTLCGLQAEVEDARNQHLSLYLNRTLFAGWSVWGQ